MMTMPDDTDETPDKTVTSFGSGGSGRYTPGWIAGPSGAGRLGAGGSPDETLDELLNAITAMAYAAGRRDALAETVDWRSILVRYARAVMGDDIVIGDRCLTDPAWCPEWTDAERQAVALVRQEALPDRWRSE